MFTNYSKYTSKVPNSFAFTLHAHNFLAGMDDFDKKFLMELFLDTDSVTTMNRLVVAVADVVNENSENITFITEVMKKEHPHFIAQVTEDTARSLDGLPVPRKRRKIYYESTVLSYTDEEYLERFRIRRNTVQMLTNYLQDLVKPSTTIVPLDKKVHIFLWMLTSDSSFSETASLFGLHKSSVAYIFNEIATILAEQKDNFICWPSTEEQHLTRIKVNSRFKFPNCVGFVDACRFKVGSKRNKKNKPENIMLQAVCDESLSFIDIHVGEVGKTKKSKLFRDSNLSQHLKNYVNFENHVLGDSEYKLRKNLITPFTSEEVLTNEEMKFNEVHWKVRSYIGHAFELLKERFLKLNHIDINKPDTIQTLLCAACVLHNFIIMHEGCPEVKEEPVTCDDGVTIDTSIVKNALEKRQFLCNYINYIDST